MSNQSPSISCTHGKGFNCRTCWPEPKRHRVMGRLFIIQAEFPDSDEGTRQANAFMEQHPGIGVLEVTGGRVILAANADKGIPA